MDKFVVKRVEVPQEETVPPSPLKLSLLSNFYFSALTVLVSCECIADGCSYMTCSWKKLGLFCTSICSRTIGQTYNNTSPILLDTNDDQILFEFKHSNSLW